LTGLTQAGTTRARTLRRAQLERARMGVRFVIRSAEDVTPSEELGYAFDQARIVIGRGAGADVRIPHLTVSESHATVRSEAEGYAIVDDGSTNGTRVNGAPLVRGRAKALRDGDLIEVGAYVLSFHKAAPARTTTVERTAELARRLFRASQAGGGVRGPRLCVLTGPDTGKSLEVPAPPARLLVGRAETCQLVLSDPDVSREHAELVRDLDGVLLTNLESKNGITVNDQPVLKRRLRDADELVLGSTRLLFEEPADEPIDSLGTEPDRALARPAPSKPPATSTNPEAAPDPAPSRKAPRRPSFEADLLIYALAAIVIAISIAGLILLMRQP
jgi:pSer/pThr/pTyr-binding forkhead associated (FHA) protein